MRIGHGYDVHRLVEGRKLILGGVEIPHNKGLLGHSDADVLTHVIMDAILGALAFGDIGRHFPDNDMSYKDASSIDLLLRVASMMEEKLYIIENIDCTIVAQEPKLSSYIEAMKEKLCAVLNISLSQLNIKATTEEGLGFTGNKEAIAAHAVCILSTIDDAIAVYADSAKGCGGCGGCCH